MMACPIEYSCVWREAERGFGRDRKRVYREGVPWAAFLENRLIRRGAVCETGRAWRAERPVRLCGASVWYRGVFLPKRGPLDDGFIFGVYM